MELQEELPKLSDKNVEKVNPLADSIKNISLSMTEEFSQRKMKGPSVPPKPQKKSNDPQVPQSKIVAEAREPLYSRPLQTSDVTSGMWLRKREEVQNGGYGKTSKSTLDNPAVLEQQLEALAYHKKQMEKRGLLGQQKQKQQLMPKSGTNIPKLSSTSLINNDPVNLLYSNVCSVSKINDCTENFKKTVDKREKNNDSYGNILNKNEINQVNNMYSNVIFQKEKVPSLAAESVSLHGLLSISTNVFENNSTEQEDDLQPPPSPVSSSYSELRRATDVFTKTSNSKANSSMQLSGKSNYIHKNYSNDLASYGTTLQNSSAYDSIYEPINPRPPSVMSSHSNYLMYVPYVNGCQIPSSTISTNLSTMGNVNTSGNNTPVYSSRGTLNSIPLSMLPGKNSVNFEKEDEVETLTDLLVQSLNPVGDVENFGICFKCNERVLGENNGCTAMDQIYHVACFTCWQCQINLQGKPFYALEGKPYCEYDYLQTLEKCSVCMKPILERILRATGKPYHPQCFTCVVCGNSLDGIPFTVDAGNKNYCITDFHKKFAPRCCVCKEPIMPEPGQEETIRVVALDRSFHLECYKCEDCGLLLSSEAEGRGCYPLDDHVLCKSCNAERVQLLTNRMTTDL